jgi:hypothetical protein
MSSINTDVSVLPTQNALHTANDFQATIGAMASPAGNAVNMTRAQFLFYAGTAAMAKANTAPGPILSLQM